LTTNNNTYRLVLFLPDSESLEVDAALDFAVTRLVLTCVLLQSSVFDQEHCEGRMQRVELTAGTAKRACRYCSAVSSSREHHPERRTTMSATLRRPLLRAHVSLQQLCLVDCPCCSWRGKVAVTTTSSTTARWVNRTRHGCLLQPPATTTSTHAASGDHADVRSALRCSSPLAAAGESDSEDSGGGIGGDDDDCWAVSTSLALTDTALLELMHACDRQDSRNHGDDSSTRPRRRDDDRSGNTTGTGTSTSTTISSAAATITAVITTISTNSSLDSSLPPALVVARRIWEVSGTAQADYHNIFAGVGDRVEGEETKKGGFVLFLLERRTPVAIQQAPSAPGSVIVGVDGGGEVVVEQQQPQQAGRGGGDLSTLPTLPLAAQQPHRRRRRWQQRKRQRRQQRQHQHQDEPQHPRQHQQVRRRQPLQQHGGQGPFAERVEQASPLRTLVLEAVLDCPAAAAAVASGLLRLVVITGEAPAVLFDTLLQLDNDDDSRSGGEGDPAAGDGDSSSSGDDELASVFEMRLFHEGTLSIATSLQQAVANLREG
jgi:hypothetical protein